MSTPTVNTASAFVIWEQSGQHRKVILLERGLPHRPFTLEGSQRGEITWYPGSPEGTATQLGPDESPTEITGKWSDKYLGRALTTTSSNRNAVVAAPVSVDNQALTTAWDAAKVIDDIRRQGQLVEVSWGRIARIGVLRKFKQSWDNQMDLEWSMSFDWISQAESVPPPVTTSESSVAGSAVLMKRGRNRVLANVTPTFIYDPDVLTRILEFVSKIVTSVNGYLDTANQLSLRSLLPGNAARRCAAIANSIANDTNALLNHLRSFPSALAIHANGALTSISSGEIVGAELWNRTLQSSLGDLRRTATLQQQQLLRQLDQDLLGSYSARDGDDLRDVSRAYYNTPNQWRALMLYNGLTSAELYVNQLVLVPKITGLTGG